jgi:DNA-binding IclR family transcriptional regulator
MSADQSAQTRLLQLIETLAGNEIQGMRLKDVSAALAGDAPNPSTTLRDLRTLEAAGWAQQMPDNRWRLGAKSIQVLHYFNAGLMRAVEAADEIRTNYTRTPANF